MGGEGENWDTYVNFYTVLVDDQTWHSNFSRGGKVSAMPTWGLWVIAQQLSKVHALTECSSSCLIQFIVYY